MSLIEVPRATFDLSDPWRLPPGVDPVPLLDACSGAAPRLSTTVSLWRDDLHLYVLFAGDDQGVVAHYTQRDEPLWQEDVVEVFLAPERPTEYFEIEVSPRGTLFDARVTSPDGSRATMQVDRSWDCKGLLAAVRLEPGLRFDAAVAIPFAGLERDAPRPGDRWLANFYRIDRSADAGDEFTAWRPTFRNPPDFHVPAAFGELHFL